MVERKKLGKTDFSMPAFGIGTWMLGGAMDRDPENDGKADAKSICRALDVGLTHIDTAEMYANGFAEEIVAEAITSYDRASLFLASKVSPGNLHKEDLLESCKHSLKRLKTEYLDLYYIHVANPQIPMEETMAAMAILKEKGLIRNIGVSNFTAKRTREAQALIDYPIVANQVHYNLRFREPEGDGLVEYCQSNDLILVAYRPVDRGFLCNRDATIIKEMCEKYSKSPAQIAINWLTSQENVVTLSTMRSEAHLEENLGGIGWTMEREDVERLRSQFPDQQEVSDRVPLG